MSNTAPFSSGDLVRHSRFGNGKVEFDKGPTTLVRFEHGIEEVAKDELSRFSTPEQTLNKTTWDSPSEVLVRTQAAAITSVNDTWGVLSRSKIALLPHQLWVCKRVNEVWPARWLVADDVGLGKTIEAGLILWPLLAKGTVKRLLILCPASLVDQWQFRLREMFDIRMVKYVSEADNAKSDFWNTHNQVVASFHTLRDDHKGRHDRLIESDPWDLVIVDEAHHLNADEDAGPTLAYKLVGRLQEERRVESMVFFTGTPHRGKNYGFLALLKLLHPDKFDPKNDLCEQLPLLKQVLIRNNKQNVTDLQGKKLFFPPIVSPETYAYSPEEEYFYEMLTDFIATGKMYANSLSESGGRVVMLVLISMQKLASSSVAAIHKALKRRLARINQSQYELKNLEEILSKSKAKFSELDSLQSSGNDDEIAKLEEQIVEMAESVHLMEDEAPRLQELIDAADMVIEETKICKIIELLKTKFAERTIVFFTEYKATQSLLISRLFSEFGDNCATFINGDNRAEGIIDSSGKIIVLSENRENAAEKFNNGKVRFIVCTEAGGEGIDLQERCHSLIHVDLPWNPMRLHQRVGRLNRYGQTRQVEVVTLRNPDTVESRIWEKLNSKIDNIMQALGSAMDEPEDLLQLVLGMTSPSMFNEVFNGASTIAPNSLGTWFDAKTAKFGGNDVIDTVKQIVGNSARFDYKEVSDKIPRIDLPALQPFLEAMLSMNGRRIVKDEEGISFKTPDEWLTEPGVRTTYENMVFDRNLRGQDAAKRVLGVGHKVIDHAIKQSLDYTSSVATIAANRLKQPFFVFKVFDRITSEKTSIRNKIVGTTPTTDGMRMLQDWELLIELNNVSLGRDVKAEYSSPPVNIAEIRETVSSALSFVTSKLLELDVPFKHPTVELHSVIYPV
ncbi:putative ATP-dependent helicase YqhH [Geobacter sp. OR-1]|uniref:DEAD/DEAH box helicase n=1 Tax=Geobacter sp. OR-1 TaxID=1266765 RepID=UPI0005425C3B|nr:SNF2-related protein [Geobacter sp. OR-1]GAM10430.1 putative ATP-dependent helicase YqhH [Geobacter sp. OR-1]